MRRPGERSLIFGLLLLLAAALGSGAALDWAQFYVEVKSKAVTNELIEENKAHVQAVLTSLEKRLQRKAILPWRRKKKNQ
jgi:type II secretory pathway component PulJ